MESMKQLKWKCQEKVTKRATSVTILKMMKVRDKIVSFKPAQVSRIFSILRMRRVAFDLPARFTTENQARPHGSVVVGAHQDCFLFFKRFSLVNTF